MGDPRKHRRKYSRPKKPWDKARLDSERELVKEYGLANKTEIYKMHSLLRKFSLQAKKLLSSSSHQSEQERKALLSKLSSLALIAEKAQLDDVLALQLKNLLERRLQTLVYRKGLANTAKQARQFVVHKHIKVSDKAVTSPSYLVSKDEENKILFIERSPLANAEHPERPEQIIKMKESSRKIKKEAKTEEKQEPAPVRQEAISAEAKSE
jgi:small subunit ribosomal protein S4